MSKEKNVLVIGANGQLGTCILNVIDEQDKKNYYFVSHKELDILYKQDIYMYIDKYDIDIVINCAAYTNVDNAEHEYKKANDINKLGVRNLAEACYDLDVFLIHISTDYVFDGRGNKPLNENDITNPINVYGKTKLDGENEILKSGCKFIILRTSWLYSEYGKNFFNNMFKRFYEINNFSLRMVYDQTGSPTYAPDLARFIVYIIKNNLYSCKEGIYHFANKGATTWYDFTKTIEMLVISYFPNTYKEKLDIMPILSEEYRTETIRPKYTVLNSLKLEEKFNYKIPYWQDSLNTCFKNKISIL